MVTLLLFVGCEQAPDPRPPTEVVDLPAPRMLRRLSLDLRGVLPSVDELEAAEADPAQVTAMRDQWLDDPALEERLVDLLAERWLTLADGMAAQPYDYGLPDDQGFFLARAVGEEPLRLVARTIVDDEPYTEIVRADHSMANELLASIWPMEGYPEGGAGWHPVQWTDGRPAAGVLATNGLWWRYTTTAVNQNRGRAAAVSSLLICTDLLQREVAFSDRAGLIEADDSVEQVRSDPACLACHSIIEPLAATLFGFYWYEDHGSVEVDHYHAERETLGEEQLGVEGAWFGRPIRGLEDLGRAIATDERFPRCAVETWAEALYRRQLTPADQALVNAATDRFVTSGMLGRELLRDLLSTPEYGAGGVTDGASDETADRLVTVRTLTPSLLETAVADLTGFRWTRRGADLVTEDFEVLAGGIDGVIVTEMQPDATIPFATLVERLAQAGGDTAARGFGSEGPFAELSEDGRPGDPEFDAALEGLVFRTTGERGSADHLDALATLWAEVEALDGAPAAWSAVLITLLRDPAFVTY